MSSPVPCAAPLLLCAAVAAQAVEPVPSPASTPAPIVHHCGECHLGDDVDGDFEVGQLFAGNAIAADDRRAIEQLELAVQRLRARTMPPADTEQPTAAARRTMIVQLAARMPPLPGSRIATVRRLTARQYEHTVADLFGIAWQDRELLPEDAVAFGFSGQGDAQSTSPLVIEKYLDAAGSVATAVLADAPAAARVFGDGEPTASALTPFLARAFRRPVTAAEVEERLADYEALHAAGLSVAAARHAWLRQILVSPAFLFRPELGRNEDPAWLSAPELAVRLSYL
ncbi:MAG: DUF1587 domain-containing protein, partial [Planctomycetes bacterium]|nr:DUF1587 domain-containing protein [Planctomycetota bacterium]